MESCNAPQLISSEDILPSNGIILSPQDLLVNAGQASAEGHGPPLAVPYDLELHAATDGLGHAKGALEGLHAHGFLGGLPVLEAGLEGVRGRGHVVLGVEGGDADAVTQGVVDAGRGGRGRGVGCVGEG